MLQAFLQLQRWQKKIQQLVTIISSTDCEDAQKGGIGLNNSFKQMAQLVVAKANGKETKQLEEKSCFNC